MRARERSRIELLKKTKGRHAPGDILMSSKDCCGCRACADICTAGAIRLVQDKEGFFYPQTDEKKCTGCGECKKVCPAQNPCSKAGDNLYFGMQAKDKGVRYSSSSGGMFSILAQYVFERQGVVYGAAYNENMEVVHTAACNMAQAQKLKRTKYVQSNPEGVYRRIRAQLMEGKWVLFCGTPCQAQALRLFLREPCPRLIIADLVCYGAPSPGIWSSYVKYLERRHGGKMTDFSFRDKRNRDNGHTCSYIIDGMEYAGPLNSDPYCKLYFNNFMLRPSCHGCRFCTVERESDFTIGDFWGIENVRPDVDDRMGSSMVILHTQKAREIWNTVKEDMLWFECKKEELLQPRLQGPTGAAGKRRQFMRLYGVLPFSFFIKLVVGSTGLRKMWRKKKG